MPNYRFTVAYNGSGFHGFARQPDVKTVQGMIEDALGRLFGDEIKTSAAGRTDAGVHALGQVVSFRSESQRDPADLARKVNSMCAPNIAVLHADLAPEGFDARFSAESRTYEYAILNREVHDPFAGQTTWHHPHALDTALMEKAAHGLLGEHDFTSFARVEDDQSPVRRLESAVVERSGDLVLIRCTANSFLQQMVRSIVGTLVKVGTSAIHPDDMQSILDAKSRAAAGPVAPPHGLFLVSVSYPEELS